MKRQKTFSLYTDAELTGAIKSAAIKTRLSANSLIIAILDSFFFPGKNSMNEGIAKEIKKQEKR